MGGSGAESAEKSSKEEAQLALAARLTAIQEVCEKTLQFVTVFSMQSMFFSYCDSYYRFF